jgi:hypothetical protein
VGAATKILSRSLHRTRLTDFFAAAHILHKGRPALAPPHIDPGGMKGMAMKRVLLACLMLAVAGVSPASAAHLGGIFNFDGQGDALVGDTYIDFEPFEGCCPFVAGFGDIQVESAIADPITGLNYFAGIGGSVGTVRDLSITDQPVGEDFVLNDFIQLNARPDLAFTLTRIEPPGFNVRAEPIGSSVSLVGQGRVTDGSEVANFVITFTTQFPQFTPEQLFMMADDESPIRSTYSATVVVRPQQVAVPEPANMALMGLALSGMAMVLRRRRS